MMWGTSILNHFPKYGGLFGYFFSELHRAEAGWNLTTFEAMPSNVALMKATLCANEELQERVDLHQVGDMAMAAWRVLYTVLPRVITG
jgi:hypothetical protein